MPRLGQLFGSRDLVVRARHRFALPIRHIVVDAARRDEYVAA